MNYFRQKVCSWYDFVDAMLDTIRAFLKHYCSEELFKAHAIYFLLE